MLVNFSGVKCALCVWEEGDTQRAHLTPEKFTEIVLHPGGGFPSARRRGGGQLPSTCLRGEQGEAPSKGSRGKKPHDTTQHHTHSRPPQTAPQHTNHPHADTPHGTSPGQEPNKTTPGITPRTIPTEAPFQENAIFHPENAHFRIPAKPRAKHTPNATTTPGRCIL